MQEAQNKLGTVTLTCLVVGAIIGGGAFALPQNLTASAQAGAILIAWIITLVGMIGLAYIFVQLNQVKPELKGGIYTYAKEGFGNFIGYISAWGYWLTAWIGNVSYAVLMFAALGFFFPIFGDGNSIQAIIAASVFLWIIHFLILSGIKQAAIINVVTTIAKIIPIIAFIVLCFTAFHWHNNTLNFWGNGLGSVFSQVESTMLVTLWVFVGIEGAVVYSARAKKSSDVTKATLLGLVFTGMVYVLITFLSLGVLSQPVLAGLKSPSMAYVLESIVGTWGAVLVNVGLVISLAGAWLGWTLLSAELPYVASEDHVLPKILSRENKHGSPSGSLWLTNILVQVFLIVVFLSHGTYLALLKLATSCILLPYLFSGMFALKLLFTDSIYQSNQKLKLKNGALALLGTLFAMFMIYSAGMHYVILGSILYLLGVPLYIWARIEARQKVFTWYEVIILLVLVFGGLSSIMHYV